MIYIKNYPYNLYISLIFTIFVIDERDIESIITNSGNPSRQKQSIV